MYSTQDLEELLSNKNNKKLVFVHTPKCGGTYVRSILSHLGIQNKGHSHYTQNDKISFTVIRNPVERFESLLNYRLDEETPRKDFPKELKYVYKNKSISLDIIVSKMTDSQILGFSPYKTLTYWTKNVDIIITIENLPRLLAHFNYNYDISLFPKKNVSSKIRGKFNELTINRITTLFNNDMILYNKVINSDLQNITII